MEKPQHNILVFAHFAFLLINITILLFHQIDNVDIPTRTDLQSAFSDKKTDPFILGVMNTLDYYVAYEVTEEGAERLLKIPVKGTILHYTLSTDETAYMVETKEKNRVFSKIKRDIYMPQNAKKLICDVPTSK